jgi:hypothetical protein
MPGSISGTSSAVTLPVVPSMARVSSVVSSRLADAHAPLESFRKRVDALEAAGLSE